VKKNFLKKLLTPYLIEVMRHFFHLFFFKKVPWHVLQFILSF